MNCASGMGGLIGMNGPRDIKIILGFDNPIGMVISSTSHVLKRLTLAGTGGGG